MNTITTHQRNPWEVVIERNPLFDPNNPNDQSKYLHTLKVRKVEVPTPDPAPIVSPIQVTYMEQTSNQTFVRPESHVHVHLSERTAEQENVLSRMAAGVASYLAVGMATRMVFGLAKYIASSLASGASGVFHSTRNGAYALRQLGGTLFAYCTSKDGVRRMLPYVIVGLFVISISILMNGAPADVETAVKDVVNTTRSLPISVYPRYVIYPDRKQESWGTLQKRLGLRP